MIISPRNVTKRLVGRYQSAPEVNAGLSRPAIFGILLYETLFLLSPSNPSNLMKVFTP